MSIIRASLSFSAENQNMWGTGTAEVDQTWEMWALNQHFDWNPSFGIDLGVASGSIGINATVDAKLGLVATLQGTSGDVSINYDYGCDIYYPDVALAGSPVEINTVNWWADNQSIISNSPNFQFDLGLAYQFDINASVNYAWKIGGNIPFVGNVTLDSGSGNLFSTSFGTNGVKTLPIVHLGMNPDAVGTSDNYFDFKLFNYSASLAADSSFNFDNWLGLPITGFLSLPSGVDTSSTNTTTTQNDTLNSYGKSPAFFEFGVDVDQLVGYFFGLDTSILSGDISLPFGAGDFQYTILSLDLVAQLALAQKFTFNPDNIVVKMTSSLGETKWGVLGDSFLFNTPTGGTGDLTFSTDYYLKGTLTNNTGINGTVLVNVDVLDFNNWWALLKKQIPLVNSDMWLFNKDIPVDLGVQHDDFSVHYSDDVASGSGTNKEVLGSDNSFEFNLTRVSDLNFKLTGLDSLVKLSIYYQLSNGRTGVDKETNINTIGEKFGIKDTLQFLAKDVIPGHFKIEVIDYGNGLALPFIGVATDPGFNVDYTITRTNHDPIFQGNVDQSFLENQTTEYNYGNAFYDQDVFNGDSLSFSVTQANGNPLPTWLQIDPTTKTISANPPTGSSDVILHIAATDEVGVTASADVIFTTPSPTDNAGNTIATARALGTLTINNTQNIYQDYVGVDGDTYDYYSISTDSSSDISAILSNITNGASLKVALLDTNGNVLSSSTWDDKTNQEKLIAANLAAGNYVVRVNADAGHGDYNMNVASSSIDKGGSSSSPTIIPLIVGRHVYGFSDYLSSLDTEDCYQITGLNARAWVSVAGLDDGSGRGWNGSFYGNSDGMWGLDVLDDDNAFGAVVWTGYISSGNMSLTLHPDTFLTYDSVWVRSGFWGYYIQVPVYNTYSGFTSTGLSIDRLPTVANFVQDQSINVSQPFSFTIANNTFQDLDNDPLISINATLADDSTLPAWLVFNSKTQTFTGQLDQLVDSISVKLTAVFNGVDPNVSDRTITDTFTITPTVIDSVGNSTAMAQPISVSNQIALNPVPSTDGNDYFALQLDHTAPLDIQLNGVSPTAQLTLFSADGTQLQTATANSEGSLQLITATLATGQYFLHLQTAADPNGYLLSIDGNYQIAPSSQPALATGSDMGLFNTDNITDITTPVLIGNAAANSTILVFDGNSFIGQTNADNSGTWNFTTPILNDGSHTLTVKVQDKIGNLSTTSDALNIIVDSQAPTASSQPVLIDTLISDLSDKPIPVLTGTSETGSTVALYDNTVFMGAALADSTGIWRFAMPELADGIHTIKAIVTDIAGNQSAPITLDISAVNFDTVAITTADTQVLMGNSKFNTVSFINAPQAISLNLATMTEQTTGFGNKTLIGIEGVIGGQFNDTLQGGDDSNVFDGGLGADLMIGGKGDDIYVVDNSGDIVNENINEGIDSIITSTINYTLGTNVENLGFSGNLSLNGTGNILSNKLIGNTAANILNGSSGDDTIIGNDGNDVLIGGAGNDILNGGAGTDTASYSNATANISVNLNNTTIQATGGSGSDTLISIEKLIGSNYNDTLIGNDAVNTLNAGKGNDVLNGGLGKDVLTGGAGNDTFVFNSKLSKNNIDHITDFVVKDDTINLENAIFKKLTTTGVLNTANFVIATAAVDNNDYITYNQTTGGLYYDVDGNGKSGAIEIALLGKNLALTNADFVVI